MVIEFRFQSRCTPSPGCASKRFCKPARAVDEQVRHGGIASGAVGMNVILLGKGTASQSRDASGFQKYPDVPAFLELGGSDPGLSLMSITGILAPGGVSDHIVNTISELSVEAGRDEAPWQKFMAAGAEQRPIGRTEFKRWVNDGGPVWTRLTGSFGLSPN